MSKTNKLSRTGKKLCCCRISLADIKIVSVRYPSSRVETPYQVSKSSRWSNKANENMARRRKLIALFPAY